VEGGVEATAEAASPQVGAVRAGPRPLVVSPVRCPPSSLLLALWVFWQNRIFAIFFRIFPESWISAQKRDTRAIFLKIALVRISCIQNTQIRGETIAKVFGKVDTFWTYHSSRPPLGRSLPAPIEALGRSSSEPSHGGPELASALHWSQLLHLLHDAVHPDAELREDGSRRRQGG
jgi:hypothetical protein